MIQTVETPARASRRQVSAAPRRSLAARRKASTSTVSDSAVVPVGNAIAERISIAEIALGAFPLRHQIDDAVVEEMAASIKVHGLLQPIIVRPHAPTDDHPHRYEVVAGYVRLLAAKHAGLTEVACVVKHLDDQTGLETALVENLLRHELAPLDEAQAIVHYKELSGLSVRGIAARLGKGRGWVQERLEVAALPKELQDLVSRRPDAASHACEINKVADDDVRSQLIGLVGEAGISLAELRKAIKERSSSPQDALSSPLASESPTAQDDTVVAPADANPEPAAGSQTVNAAAETAVTVDAAIEPAAAPHTEVASDEQDAVFGEVQTTMRYLLGVRPPKDKTVRQRLHQDLYELMGIVMNLLAKIEECRDET